MEYLYRCVVCNTERIRLYRLSEDKPTKYSERHRRRGSTGGECVGQFRRVIEIVNLNNVNRFGTRSKRDTGRDR